MRATTPTAGIPTVLYGAGPREVNPHRADECLVLDDLWKATEVVAAPLPIFLRAATAKLSKACGVSSRERAHGSGKRTSATGTPVTRVGRCGSHDCIELFHLLPKCAFQLLVTLVGVSAGSLVGAPQVLIEVIELVEDHGLGLPHASSFGQRGDQRFFNLEESLVVGPLFERLVESGCSPARAAEGITRF